MGDIIVTVITLFHSEWVSISGSRYHCRVLGDQGQLSWDSALASADKQKQTLLDVSDNQMPQLWGPTEDASGIFLKFVHLAVPVRYLDLEQDKSTMRGI